MRQLNILFERMPRQKQPALTDDELTRLWKAAISEDEPLIHEVIHDLRGSYASLRDGIFLF